MVGKKGITGILHDLSLLLRKLKFLLSQNHKYIQNRVLREIFTSMTLLSTRYLVLNIMFTVMFYIIVYIVSYILNVPYGPCVNLSL